MRPDPVFVLTDHRPLTTDHSPGNPRAPVVLAIAAAVVTIGLKAGAYLVTGSIGLFSDALESGVNLLAAVTAYLSLRYADRPADPSHAYGHEKVEFFSSGLEGSLVAVAGVGTAVYAVRQLVYPAPLDELGVGAVIALAAAGVNAFAARGLLRAGRRHDSPVLDAAGHHLMSDVWTSLAVVAGLGLVKLTDVPRLDAALAFLVGLGIVRTGYRLVKESVHGLMDHALPAADRDAIRAAIAAALPADDGERPDRAARRAEAGRPGEHRRERRVDQPAERHDLPPPGAAGPAGSPSRSSSAASQLAASSIGST